MQQEERLTGVYSVLTPDEDLLHYVSHKFGESL